MKNNMKQIYLCEDTPEGIFTAVYDTWNSHLSREQFCIRVEDGHELELFAEYNRIQTSREKALKVVRTVKKQLGKKAYDMVFAALLSHEEDKADAIYYFLKLGFRTGPEVVSMHGQECVCRVFEIKRNVWNEAHFTKEFLRFCETEEKILLARISPKNQVLPLVAEHFADRFPEENFVVLDEVHNIGLFHEKGKQWYLSGLHPEALNEIWAHRESSEYEKLWKTFFHTISIRERENYRCQRTNCAIRYREYMTEFG